MLVFLFTFFLALIMGLRAVFRFEPVAVVVLWMSCRRLLFGGGAMPPPAIILSRRPPINPEI